MDEKEIYRMHADMCKFMGNPKRIEVIFILGEEEMNVDEIAERMGIRHSNLSQHLSIMREKGIITARREGTRMYYRITNKGILTACTMMRDVMFEQMKERLSVMEEASNSSAKKGKAIPAKLKR